MLGENRELKMVKVTDLSPASRWFALRVKVLNVGEERTVFSRRDSEEHKVADALVGDETGTILFSVWDHDIDRVKEAVGSTIMVKNGYVTVFRGSMRLSLGRFGTIEPSEEEITEVNMENNVSEKKVEQSFKWKPRGRYTQRRRFR